MVEAGASASIWRDLGQIISSDWLLVSASGNGRGWSLQCFISLSGQASALGTQYNGQTDTDSGLLGQAWLRVLCFSLLIAAAVGGPHFE
jgi:hypothetical protein